MKKLGLLVMPLMAVSFLTNCGGGGSTPTEDVKFSAQSEVELDKYNKKAIISLDWTPTSHSIECSDFTFTLNNQSDITSTITLGELGSRPLKVTIDFTKALEANDKGDLKFKYNDKTTKKEGEGKVTNINVKLHEVPPTPGTYTISMETEGVTITPEELPTDKAYKGTIEVTAANKILNGLTSVILQDDSNTDITQYCTYDPEQDNKSASLEIPLEYLTNDIEITVALIDEPEAKGTVKWVNYNDTPLVDSYELPVGSYAEYKGDTPTHPKDGSYVYQFSGWDKDPTVTPIVDGDNVFKAQFDKVATTNLAANMKLVISSSNDDLTFSFVCTATKKITVDWGDNTVDNNKSHTYSENGTYNIGIYGEDITTVSAGEKGKDYLSELELKNKITAIPDNAFKSCTSLTKVTVPSSVASLGEYAFAYCTSLSEISALTNITSISAHAFDSCALTAFAVLTKVTEIGEYAFANCTSLKTVVTEFETLKTIGAHAFESCGLIEFLTPDGVTSIGAYAFASCTELTSVSLPDNIASIGDCAFDGCNSLAFTEYGNCKYLGNSSNTHLALIKYTSSSITSVTIHSDCKIICDYALGMCNKLTTVTIPDSVNSIGIGAFQSCKALTTVNINNSSSLTKICNKAFQDCSKLNSINIPDNVASIGNYAFSFCDELSSVSISSSSALESIGDYAFLYCKALNSINITNKVKSIGISAFRQCEKLSNITIPNSVKSIGDEAFKNCALLESVVLTAFVIENPDNIPSLGSHAFDGCDALTALKVANNDMAKIFKEKDGWKDYADKIKVA